MRWSIVAAAAALMNSGAASAAPPPAEVAWQGLARADAEAALALITDNHPGAAPELGDTAFQARLATARATVERRLPEVKNYGSYAALMLGLANAFGDGHIWSNGRMSPASTNWPRLVSIRRAGKWWIGKDYRGVEGQDLAGAQIVGCDGIAADALGKARVGSFYADPASEAAIASKAYTLLLDPGNPWAPPLKTCTVRLKGNTETVTLDWKEIRPQDLTPKIIEAMHTVQAGMGISELPGGGKWIALATLEGEAEAVVADAERRSAELRAAPLVVVDLRGNGGGNSDYSDRLTKALVGEERLVSASVSGSGCDGAFWRASPGNLEAVRDYARERTGEGRAYFEEIAATMVAAMSEKRSFAPALPACAAHAEPKAAANPKLAPSAMTGRLVLLTDRSCFSSCLIAADLFRRVGALHVGEETDRSTRYMEVREILLPSGLRTFSTLMKVAVGLPDYGPFAPDIVYEGPLDDDAALKAWIAGLKR